MSIKLLKDLDFSAKLQIAEPITESALDVVKRYRGYMYVNAPTCGLVNNFIREAHAYAYDKGMSAILESVEKFITDNKISWKLATACESIQNNNSTYSYIAKLGINKVQQLLEMNENDVVAYIKAGALKGVKYIPEFREICKDVYRSSINETLETVNYAMHTPVSYKTINENGMIVSILGKTFCINENKVSEIEYNDDPYFNEINAHLSAFNLVGESLEYSYDRFNFSLNEDKLTVKFNGNEHVFESETEFLQFADNISHMMNMAAARQFMNISGAIAKVFEAYDNIVLLDNVRVFEASNGTKAIVIEGKDNALSYANGIVKESEFMIDALKNVQENCDIDIKSIYENRINEDLKKGDPEQYQKIQEQLTATKDAQAAIRYQKIEKLAEALKDDPASIAVLNSLTKDLRLLEEGNVNEALATPKSKDELRNLIENIVKNKNFDALNNINISKITDMSYLFKDLDISTIDLSKWDVSNVTDMTGMFMGCEKFNSDISAWDVSKVIRMTAMFQGCKNFNCDLSAWDVRNVKDMQNAFKNCETQPNWYKG